MKLNQIYNFSYTGCQLWDLFCKEAELENTFNVSVRRMMDLPKYTQRHLVPPLENGIHVKQVFASIFLKFCEKLSNSPKISIRDTFEKVKFNIKTTTGNNLAKLGELLNKPVNELSPSDASNIVFAKVDDANKYRIKFIKDGNY